MVGMAHVPQMLLQAVRQEGEVAAQTRGVEAGEVG